MFPDKKHEWITSDATPFYKVSFQSWKDWLAHRTDKTFGWVDYKFIIWNIMKFDNLLNFETGSDYKVQLLYIKRYGTISINEICITVKESDEASIREWVSTAFSSV